MVKSQRSALGISQEELADRAGLHRTYISDVERGARNLSLESIQKLASALQLSVSKLFEQADAPKISADLLEILLVEDHAPDAELTRRALKRARIANPIRIIEDGAAALDFLFARGAFAPPRDAPLPGLILLDLNLPGVSGLEVLRNIKMDKRLRNIPVIILTASSRDRDISACERLGVMSYIVKPVGFGNFSEIASQLPVDWALIHPSPCLS